MPTRLGSQGAPLASADARLYMTRRLAGHEKPQLWNMPSPVGSAVLRRWVLLPASVKQPECSQFPHIVEPSSRHSPKPESCCPAGRMTLVGSLGSVRSLSALPLISLSTPLRSGLAGLAYAREILRTGSGNCPVLNI